MQRTGESGHDFLVDHLARPPLITTLGGARTDAPGDVREVIGKQT
jgi:hypothetical protein